MSTIMIRDLALSRELDRPAMFRHPLAMLPYQGPALHRVASAHHRRWVMGHHQAPALRCPEVNPHHR